MSSERDTIIDAIEGRGWRQEIRSELLCKLQQKLSAHPLNDASAFILFALIDRIVARATSVRSVPEFAC
jgi:hypothetical protein